MTSQNPRTSPKNGQVPELVFITQTGPTKPKDVQTQIKKHVMKGIGKSRRKARWHNKPPAWELSIRTPNLADNQNQAPGAGHHFPDRESGAEENSLGNSLRPVVGSRPLNVAQPLQNADAAAPSHVSIQASQQTLPQAQPQSQELVQAVPRIERLWTGRLDPFFNYPIRMDYRSLQLIDHLFDDRYGNTPPFREIWFPVGLLDPAGFHQLLCNASINIESLRLGTNPNDNLEAMRYHAQAIQSINERISDVTTATSDGFLGTIVSLACYNHALGDLDGFRLHMRAAFEIIRLRGGIKNIETNKWISMVILWTEVSASATLDVPPIFPIPYKILPQLLSLDPGPLSVQALQIVNTWAWTFPHQPEVLKIMRDARAFSRYLKSEATRTNGKIYSDGLFAASYMLPPLHRLLSLATSDIDVADQGNNVVQAVRLSCCLFFTETRRLFGLMGIHSSLQTQKLKLLLEHSTDRWGRLGLLKLWCLAMGGMESIGQERIWYLRQLTLLKDDLGLNTWEDVEEELKEVLWYEDVHNIMFRELSAGQEQFKPKDRGGGSRFGGHRPITALEEP